MSSPAATHRPPESRQPGGAAGAGLVAAVEPLMSAWISQHFLQPGLFWPAVGLLALPVLIHLINRLRFRRVKFAAMEFLLASQQRNRRRILLEHLLLLALRVMIVGLIGLLIARFVADPKQLSLFQGARAHHVVILDDSGSMRERRGETTAFAEACDVVRKLVAEGAARPETQALTLLLMSRPGEALGGLTERNVDDALLDELSTRLEDLECTYGAADPAPALEAARVRLEDDRGAVRHVHLISDFRRRDWFDNKAAASAVRGLSDLGVAVNFVRATEDSPPNLAVTALTADAGAAAVGVPVSLTATVENFGARDAEQVRLAVQVDGRPLPLNLVFDRVPSGEAVQRDFDVIFDAPQTHRVSVSLEADALEADDTRRLAVSVPEDNPVLIVDGAPSGEPGRYIADALAADKSVTGYAAVAATPDYLRRHPLEGFRIIYLVNVPELPEDAVVLLEKFARAGGGVAWFMGDAVQPSFYNDRLYQNGQGLFPVRLANAPARLPRAVSEDAPPDITPADHPLFRILRGADNPFIDAVFVNTYYPVDEDQLRTDLARPDGVELLAELRNRAPLMLESRYGAGRIVCCLTAAGPLPTREGDEWTNWASGPGAPSYAVMHLELARRLARSAQVSAPQTVGEQIVIDLDAVQYQDAVEIVGPNDQVVQLTALPEGAHPPAVDGGPSSGRDGASDESPHGDTATPLAPGPGPDATVERSAIPTLRAVFRDTRAPGFYTVSLLTSAQQAEQRQLAFNVPDVESRLDVSDDALLRRELGEGVEVTIQPAGSLEWIRAESPGRELRWGLLAALLVLFVAEQALACRLSYHPSESTPRARARPAAVRAAA